MDVDSEDDQMMRAIALSLGQNVSSLESEVKQTQQSESLQMFHDDANVSWWCLFYYWPGPVLFCSLASVVVFCHLQHSTVAHCNSPGGSMRWRASCITSRWCYYTLFYQTLGLFCLFILYVWSATVVKSFISPLLFSLPLLTGYVFTDVRVYFHKIGNM